MKKIAKKPTDDSKIDPVDFASVEKIKTDVLKALRDFFVKLKEISFTDRPDYASATISTLLQLLDTYKSLLDFYSHTLNDLRQEFEAKEESEDEED